MKYTHLFFSIFIINLLSWAVPAGATQPVGQWKIHSIFTGVDKMVDTRDMVFYLSGGQLYSYDKDSGETYNYTTACRLSSPKATDIHYNYDKKYLVVSYDDANIDIIDADDRVYNMPDIKDAELNVIPIVNNVCFDGDKIYVATNFGIVVYDYKKKEVITSGNYGRNITHVLVVGDNLWIIESWKFHVIDKNSSLIKFSGYKEQVFGQTVDEILTFDDNNMLLLSDHGKHLRMFTLVPEEGKSKLVYNYDTQGVKNLSRMSDGGFMAHDNTHIYTISPDGNVSIYNINGSKLESKVVNDDYENHYISAYEGLDDVYMGDAAGLSKFSVSPGEITRLMDPVKMPGLTFSKVGRLTTGPSGKVYASYFGNSLWIEAFNNTQHHLYNANVIENGVVTDITPTEFTVEDPCNKSFIDKPYGFRSGNQLVEDPYDPDAYYITSEWDGIYHFKEGKQINKFYTGNSTLEALNNNGGLRVYTMAFDPKGNMWVAQYIHSTLSNEGRQFHKLSSDKLKNGVPNTTAADWQVLPFKRSSHREGLILPLKHSNVIIYKDATYEGSLTAIKTQGTESISDDEIFNSTSLVDQDGLTFTYRFIFDIVEDKRGHVWVSTDNGVFSIANPEAINDTRFQVNHIKVPRNDGTNFADYLLSGENVFSIAVDHSNRKWLTTEMSGVYLVSPDGDRIIAHYDVTNSPLPSNEVFAVTCGPDNSVYFGTLYGLIEYSSESAPAGEDFSQVYAYPNPVRPEFTGIITITGLMENSHVKIADAAGNVIYQAMSEGGMLTWDGCNSTGRRVPTGVYYVLASHNGDNESTRGVVTKILVVN